MTSTPRKPQPTTAVSMNTTGAPILVTSEIVLLHQEIENLRECINEFRRGLALVLSGREVAVDPLPTPSPDALSCPLGEDITAARRNLTDLHRQLHVMLTQLML